MATETVPHAKVMESIELFGTHVIPELESGFRLANLTRIQRGSGGRETLRRWTRAGAASA